MPTNWWNISRPAERIAVFICAALLTVGFLTGAPERALSQGVCLQPGQTKDADIKRNAAALAGFCITEHAFSEGGINWLVYTLKGSRPGPLWAVPHDNEDAALIAAIRAARKYGGNIATVESGNSRFYNGIDTNRNFSTAARCPGGRGPSPKYTRAFLSAGGNPVISIHTNANGPGGNMWASVNTGSLKGFPSASAKGGLADQDSFILVPGRQINQAAVNRFNQRGAHVVAEIVSAANNDCSLSNYLVLSGRPNYFTVEAQHGNTSALLALIDIVMGR